jgi:hypothetical protein
MKEQPGIDSFLHDVTEFRRLRDERSRGNLDQVVVKAESGPFIDSIMGILRRPAGVEQIKGERALRERYKSSFDEVVKETYNRFFFTRDAKGAVLEQNIYNGEKIFHAQFAAKVEETFWTGFELFLKSQYRGLLNDFEKKIPPPEWRTVSLGGGRKQRYKVEQPTPHQMTEQHIVKTYAEKYGISIRTPESPTAHELESVKNAYALDQVRLFAVNFFPLLRESLARKVPLADALNLAEHAYGFGSRVFAEMEQEPHPLSTHLVTHVLKYYPSQARTRLETYKKVWGDIEATYLAKPEGGATAVSTKSWVTSEEQLRNLVFGYPHTCEAGLKIVDEHLNRLVAEHPYIPQDIIIRECVAGPDVFDTRLKEYDERIDSLISDISCTEKLCGATDKPLFEMYELRAVVANMVVRTPARTHERTLQRAKNSLESVIDAAAQTDIKLSVGARRRILRTLVEQKGSQDAITPEKVQSILRIEERVYDRRRGLFMMLDTTSRGYGKRGAAADADRKRFFEKMDGLVGKAEAKDAIFGLYHVLFGEGETDEARLEDGAFKVGYFVTGRFGESYRTNYTVERFLEHQADTLLKLLNARDKSKAFPRDNQQQLALLVEALIVEPESPKKYYNGVALTLQIPPWPETVSEITYAPEWGDEPEE